MAKRLDEASRGILAYRPTIRFIEPEVMPGEIEPIETPVQLEEIVAEREKVKQLAKAVNALATATQARADEKAKEMVIKLDPLVDQQVVIAMKRKYPGEDPTKITYGQYKSCKEDFRKKGEEIGKQATITPDQVQKAAQDQDSGTFNQLGGWNTPDARDGGLRPELDKNSQIIPPLDIPEFQDIMICILANFLWKKFILDAAKKIPGAGRVLPDKLCDVPEGMADLMSGLGIKVLGE